MGRFVIPAACGLCLLYAAGCRASFNGAITFENVSEVDLEEVTVYGFPRDPPCGVLVTGQEKMAFMGPMALPLPKEVKLIWRHGVGPEQETVLALPPEALHARGGELD